MITVNKLFGEFFDCKNNLDFGVAEIVNFAISRENNRAELTIKPYRTIEDDRIKAFEDELSRATNVNIKIICDESRKGFTTEYAELVIEIVKG